MSVQAMSPSEEQTEAPSTERPDEFTKDQIFHVLQTQRRRDALRYLAAHENPVEMRELAEQVAAWENDTTVEALTSAERQRVYIALYQSHLPKLDREGIIDYNQSRGIVERTERAAAFDPYLEPSLDPADEPEPVERSVADERRTEPAREAEDAAGETTHRRWLSYYQGTTLVGALALAGAWLGVQPLSLLSNGIIGLVMITTFTIISVVQFTHGLR